MTLFIIIALLITALSCGILVWPLLKVRNSASFDRQQQNIHFAQERLAELKEQRENNSISSEDYDALRHEIESNLAQDIDINQPSNDETATDQTKRETNGIVVTLLCCLIPFLALLLYLLVGRPQALNQPLNSGPATANTSAAATQASSTSTADIEAMVKALEQRMQADPSDVKGWTILARTYAAMGRYAQAISANQHLLEIGDENPDVLAALADATALNAQGQINQEAIQYINRALELNPQQPQALWLAGLSATQLGDNTQARKYWNQLLPLLANQPEQQRELREIMAQTEQKPTLGVISNNESSSSSSDNTEAGYSSGLTIMVSLKESLTAKTSPDDTVFIFARALQGPPAPLAVKRLSVKNLPATVQLNDSDAMIPQFKLSMFEEISVSARVALSGNPVAQTGDLQSVSLQTSNSEAATLKLVIENIID